MCVYTCSGELFLGEIYDPISSVFSTFWTLERKADFLPQKLIYLVSAMLRFN